MKFKVLVEEVMKRNIISVGMDDSIEKAAKLMKKYRIGSVLVMGEKQLKGILTTRDIVYKSVASGKGKVAKDIMSKDVISISPKKTIEHAAKLMVEKKVEKLPVFEMNKLVGIITNTDILRIEPALFDILLERMKIGSRGTTEPGFGQCEECGNYSDDIDEVDGIYKCGECRSKW